MQNRRERAEDRRSLQAVDTLLLKKEIESLKMENARLADQVHNQLAIIKTELLEIGFIDMDRFPPIVWAPGLLRLHLKPFDGAVIYAMRPRRAETASTAPNPDLANS